MEFQFDNVSEVDQSLIRTCFAGLPDDLLCEASRRGSKYILWTKSLSQPAHGYLLISEELNREDLLHNGRLATRIIQAKIQEEPAFNVMSDEEARAMRIDDFRRSMPEHEVQEKLEKGELPGVW